MVRDQSPYSIEREVRSFGRRRGRKRSARQNSIFRDGLARWGLELSQPAPENLQALFSSAMTQCWLEVGFGGGEHLIWQAEHNPEIGFIAAEPFEDGVVKALSAIGERKLENVRIYPADVRPLLRWLRPNTIDRAFVLFPDPWPKSRHAKRRLVAKSLLDALARVMRDDGELRVATDIASYAAAILQAVHHHPGFGWQVAQPSDWRVRPDDWPETRYEAKARRANRQPYFFKFHHFGAGKPVGKV